MERMINCSQREFILFEEVADVKKVERHIERAEVHYTKSRFLGFIVHVLGEFIYTLVGYFLKVSWHCTVSLSFI